MSTQMDLEVYIPFNSINGDRRHNAYGLREMVKTLLSNGVFPQPDAGFFVYAAGGWTVKLAPGRCVLDGAIGISNDEMTFIIPAPTGVGDFICRVVIRLDEVARKIYAIILVGDPAQSPQPPTIRRDEYMWDLSVARIYVKRDAEGITDAVITDERAFQSVCGYCTAIPPLDTESLFRQYAAQWSVWSREKEQEITAWLASMIAIARESDAEVAARIAALETGKADRPIDAYGYTVPASAWKLDEEGFLPHRPYCADIEVLYVREDMKPFVIFEETDTIAGNLASNAKTFDWTVRIYATAPPGYDLTIPTITCFPKGVISA